MLALLSVVGPVLRARERQNTCALNIVDVKKLRALSRPPSPDKNRKCLEVLGQVLGRSGGKADEVLIAKAVEIVAQIANEKRGPSKEKDASTLTFQSSTSPISPVPLFSFESKLRAFFAVASNRFLF